MILKPFETIYTDHLEVQCDGGNGPLGHPRIFLHIDSDKNKITCPYCSRQYIYSPEKAKMAG